MMRTADEIEIKAGMPAWLARRDDTPLLVMVVKVDADTLVVESAKAGRKRVRPDQLWARRERAPNIVNNGMRWNGSKNSD